MISCRTFGCWRRPTLRAALIALLAFSGCQGSLRTWRRDSPNVRDLVGTPRPLDEAELEEIQSRDAYVDGSRRASGNAAAKSKAGRPNPYANRSLRDTRPTEDADNVRLEDPSSFAAEDRELMAEISQADPQHRALLVQMYQAMQASRQAARQPDADYDQDSEQPYDEAESDVDEAPAREARPRANSAAARTVAKNQTAARSMSQEEVVPAVAMTGRGKLQPASATEPADELGNRSTRMRSEAIHAHMSDDSEEEEDARPRVSSKAAPARKPRVQEMKPPAGARAEHRKIQDPVVDTGYEEQVSSVPRAHGPREDNRHTSSRRLAAAYTDVASDPAVEPGDEYTDRGAVVPASATAPIAEREEPIIRPSTRSGSRAISDKQPVSEPASGSQASSSAATNAQEDWRELVQKSLRALEQESIDSSATAQLNHHVTKRALLVLLGQLDQALEPIPGLQAHEQEYFRHSFQALYNSIDPRGNPVLARRWPLVMEDHRSAMSHLGAVSNLEVKNAAFCSNVDGFGAVTRFPSNQFRPNQELLLYCEVENFVSEQIKDGYETKLRGNYEILDASQTRVADFILPEEADICKSPRRDYFFVYRIYTPANIAPGRYQLRLTIEDMKGNKFGQTSLDLQIVAP